MKCRTLWPPQCLPHPLTLKIQIYHKKLRYKNVHHHHWWLCREWGYLQSLDCCVSFKLNLNLDLWILWYSVQFLFSYSVNHMVCKFWTSQYLLFNKEVYFHYNNPSFTIPSHYHFILKSCRIYWVTKSLNVPIKMNACIIWVIFVDPLLFNILELFTFLNFNFYINLPMNLILSCFKTKQILKDTG